MGDAAKVREIVERVVNETLDAHISILRQQIVDRAARELEGLVPETGTVPVAASPAPADEPTPAGGFPTDLLNAALATVFDSNSQADILVSLLDGTSKFSRRSALFVIRGGNAVGWRGRGFDKGDAIKNMPIDLTSGLASRAYSDRQSVQAAAAEFDHHFIETFGEPLVGTNSIVLPLVLRDKVAALVYADGGADGKLDPSALECMVRSAGLWLEVVSMRRAGSPVEEESERTGTQRITARPDAAEHVAPPPPKPTPEPEPEPVVAAPPPPPEPEPVVAAPPEPVPTPAPVAVAAAAVAAPSDAMSFEEQEVHKKAKRFAKLLVDELKLYNQQKVADGRANRDLYRRLKDDIDKSRASYEKRYGQTAAGSSDYFNTELVRILCDGDPAMLGAGYSK